MVNDAAGKRGRGGWVRGERVLKLLSVIYDKCNLFTTRCSFIQDKLFASLPTQLHGKLLAGLTGRMANGTPEQLSSSMATNNTTKTKTTGRKQTSKEKAGEEGERRQARQTNNALCEKLLHFKQLRKIDLNFIALCSAAVSRQGEGERAKGSACVGG